MVPLSWYLTFAAALFALGLYAVLARKNAVAILMGVRHKYEDHHKVDITDEKRMEKRSEENSKIERVMSICLIGFLLVF